MRLAVLFRLHCNHRHVLARDVVWYQQFAEAICPTRLYFAAYSAAWAPWLQSRSRVSVPRPRLLFRMPRHRHRFQVSHLTTSSNRPPQALPAQSWTAITKCSRVREWWRRACRPLPFELRKLAVMASSRLSDYRPTLTSSRSLHQEWTLSHPLTSWCTEARLALYPWRYPFSAGQPA